MISLHRFHFDFRRFGSGPTWMPGTSPGMTVKGDMRHDSV
jgi:hypothetical protein